MTRHARVQWRDAGSFEASEPVRITRSKAPIAGSTLLLMASRDWMDSVDWISELGHEEALGAEKRPCGLYRRPNTVESPYLLASFGFHLPRTYSCSPAVARVVFLLQNMRGRGSWIDTVLKQY